MKNVFFSLMLMFSTATMACSEDGKTGFVEENDLYIPADTKNLTGLNEAQFNAVIAKIETMYAPVVSGMGGKLSIARLWSNGTVNANATRSGSNWKVNMYGGLARHQTVTEDGFSLVLCHEIGHHLGGAPKVANFLTKWASNEGQSDYFASLKCLRRVFLNDDNATIISSMQVPAPLTAACAKNHINRDEQAICIRTGMAGMSVADLFAALRNSPPAKFETPDASVVNATNNSHPAHQCRLDTFFQGSLCEASLNEDVSQTDEVKGTCHKTTGQTIGLRPLCWFKPKVI